PQPAEQPRQERPLLPAAQRLPGEHGGVPRQPAEQLPPAGVPPEHPLLVARLLFEHPPAGPLAVGTRHPVPDDGAGLVDDLAAAPPQPQRQVHVLEVRAEVLGEPAGAQQRVAAVERGARGGTTDTTRRAGGVSPPSTPGANRRRVGSLGGLTPPARPDRAV